jgi:hypothetical protein
VHAHVCLYTHAWVHVCVHMGRWGQTCTCPFYTARCPKISCQWLPHYPMCSCPEYNFFLVMFLIAE